MQCYFYYLLRERPENSQHLQREGRSENPPFMRYISAKKCAIWGREATKGQWTRIALPSRLLRNLKIEYANFKRLTTSRTDDRSSWKSEHKVDSLYCVLCTFIKPMFWLKGSKLREAKASWACRNKGGLNLTSSEAEKTLSPFFRYPTPFNYLTLTNMNILGSLRLNDP